MNKKAKVIAASLCAAQVITMIPLSAAAAEPQLSTTTIAVGETALLSRAICLFGLRATTARGSSV